MLTFRDATADQAGLISHIYATSWRKTYRGILPSIIWIVCPMNTGCHPSAHGCPAGSCMG